MSSHLLKLRRLQQVSATSKSRSVGVEDSYFRRFRRNPWFHVALGGATSLMAYVLLDESIVAEDVSQSNNANTSNQHDMYLEAAQLLEKNTQRKTQFPLPILPIIASPLLQPHRCDCEASKFNLFGRISSLRRSNTIETYKSETCKHSVRSMYRVNWKKPLGQGGFGAVYAATDRKTGEKVALKQISKKYTDNLGFQREMEAFLHLRRHG